ncbi:MAG: PH domain-containing protein [Melioribacteraceae bacterium]|nr:PH domain-containing protein [Melioribacteraceae bacterium]MCF8354022.1 PH domain-containing protein [Melioribacteraceae bacterium]MCF8392297.1 PH domain-containing protein [Melioribacteraceae bacterium]MCF8417629.1 PH domain-containing protein [Melioribacteraceae bacterium]
MEDVEFKPDRKLITKQYMLLAVISFFVVVSGVLLQSLIPLDPKISGSQVAIIVWPIILGICILLWAISVPLILIYFKNLKYEITDERVIIHKGIISRLQQNIPFRGVTDFMLHRSPFDRILGLGSIRIQTAGQSSSPTGYEGNLAGLIDWNERLKFLQLMFRNAKTASPISVDDSTDEPVSDKNIFNAILSELKEIKELLKK